jgi:hypothetical protein
MMRNSTTKDVKTTDSCHTGSAQATTVVFYKKYNETVQEIMYFRESRCSKFVYCPETKKLICK